MVRLKAKRKEVAYLIEKYQVSTSRGCKLLGLHRSTFDYQESPCKDTEVSEALLRLSDQNKRFGLPRLHLLLKREENMVINHKRTARIYRLLGLQLRKRKKLGAGRSSEKLIPYGSDEVLAIDFVFDYT